MSLLLVPKLRVSRGPFVSLGPFGPFQPHITAGGQYEQSGHDEKDPLDRGVKPKESKVAHNAVDSNECSQSEHENAKAGIDRLIRDGDGLRVAGAFRG